MDQKVEISGPDDTDDILGTRVEDLGSTDGEPVANLQANTVRRTKRAKREGQII